MKKLITPVLLLLSAAVLLFGARLPQNVAAVQDHVDINQVHYAPISEVHLEFDEDTPTIKQLVLAKLGQKTTNTPVSSKFCARTAENILSIAQETIDAYVDAGLIPFDIDAGQTMTDCGAYLSYSYRTGISCVLWDVVLCAPEWSDWNLTMTVDDQSGRVLDINFTYYQEDIYSRPVDDYQNTFCELFLAGLGPEFAEYDAAYRKQNTLSDMSMEDVQTYIHWWDAGYGDVRLVLDLHPSGFVAYVMIPSSK